MSRQPRLVIAGGSGFLGHALIEHLHQDFDLVILSRSKKAIPSARVVVWDASNPGSWASEVDGSAGVINLTGKSIFSRWTDENKKEILGSRVDSTTVIGQAIAAATLPPPVWLNGSAVGYYGDAGEAVLDEGSQPGIDFMAKVCRAWEDAVDEAETPNTRRLKMRTGIVLGRNGGAIEPLVKVTKLFLGGALGSGAQWMPWIHVEDLVAAIRWCLDKNLVGPVNMVGPNPVTNGEMMKELRSVLHRPWIPPAPKFILDIGKYLGGPEPEMVLTSEKVFPKALLDSGFQFKFPHLRAALENLLD